MAKEKGQQNYPNEWEHYIRYDSLLFPWPYDIDLTVEVLNGEEIFNAAYANKEIPAQGYGRTQKECLRALARSTVAYLNFLRTIPGEPPEFKDNARVRDWTPKKNKN